MKVIPTACAFVFLASSALAGESPYNPQGTSPQQMLASCSKDIATAQSRMSATHTANRPKAEEYLQKAQAAYDAGNAAACYNNVQKALHWEQ